MIFIQLQNIFTDHSRLSTTMKLVSHKYGTIIPNQPATLQHILAMGHQLHSKHVWERASQLQRGKVALTPGSATGQGPAVPLVNAGAVGLRSPPEQQKPPSGVPTAKSASGLDNTGERWRWTPRHHGCQSQPRQSLNPPPRPPGTFHHKQTQGPSSTQVPAAFWVFPTATNPRTA